MLKILSICIVTSLLYGCSDTTPIQISDENSRFIGVWQFRFEEVKDNSLKIDNILLAINADSTAIYRKCEVNKKKTENSSSGSSFSTNFPQAVVTHMSESSIIVAQKLGWFGFDQELVVNKPPYQENQYWYVEIEGKKLARLSGSDIPTKTNWVCPKSDDDD